MKTEYLIWMSTTKFIIKYDEQKAIQYAKKNNAGEIEKCTITPGGLIIESEIIWQKSNS